MTFLSSHNCVFFLIKNVKLQFRKHILALHFQTLQCARLHPVARTHTYPVHPHTNSPGRTEWPRSAKTLQSSSVHSHTGAWTHAHGYTHTNLPHSAVLSTGSLSGPVKWLAQHCTLLPHLFKYSHTTYGITRCFDELGIRQRLPCLTSTSLSSNTTFSGCTAFAERSVSL